ncbi:MAG: methyltransferase domain-containing protein [Mycobacteriales bacterium]
MTFDSAAFDAFERTNWEKAAASYLDGFARLSVVTVDPLLDAIGASPGVRLLDVGCGPGVLSRRALERGCAVDGIDVTDSMIEIARSSLPSATFVQGDVQAGLPFGDNAFHAVAGNMVVHHLSQPERAMPHLLRVLAPGGKLGLTMWDPPADNPAQGIFPEAVALAGAPTPPGVPVLKGRPDDAFFTELLTAAGLREADVTHIHFEFVVAPEQWWDAVITSTVLTATMITQQTAAVQQEIRAAYDGLVRRYVDDSGQARFPGSATLAVGTR